MGIPAECVYITLDMYYRGESISDIRMFLMQEFSYLPSRTIIYEWIQKYTDKATAIFKSGLPQVGDLWILGETVRKLAGRHRKFYDIVDAQTHYLLATQIALVHSNSVIKSLVEDAKRTAGKRPDTIMTLVNYSYFDKIKKILDCEAEFLHFLQPEAQKNIHIIKCFVNVFEPRYKIIRNIKNPARLSSIMQGWSLYYNYFQKQSELADKTPADTAGISYSIKGWQYLKFS